jgi:hypothetical protein
VDQNASLIGSRLDFTAVDSNECFGKCDSDLKCAAACFKPPTKCGLFWFGGYELLHEHDSTTYIKSEVTAELSREAALNDTFPLVRQRTRFTNSSFFTSFDTLLPSWCFRKCAQSDRCGGASFTADVSQLNNCFLYRPGAFVGYAAAYEVENWTSYVKVNVSLHEAAVTFTATTTTTSGTTTTTFSSTSEVMAALKRYGQKGKKEAPSFK